MATIKIIQLTENLFEITSSLVSKKFPVGYYTAEQVVFILNNYPGSELELNSKYDNILVHSKY